MIQLITIVALILLALLFAFLYFSLRRSIRQLDQNILEKRKEDSNLLLTLSVKNQALSDLTREINDLFDELRRLDVKSKQEKDSFTLALHNITHDIRTPLTIASGYTQALLKRDSAEVEDLQKIKQNLDTVAKRLEILLDYQNLLEVKMLPSFETINLAAVVKEQLLKFYESFEFAGFRVEFHLAENVMIEADEELLARILQNLLGNVLKHGTEYLEVALVLINARVELTIKNKSQQAIKNLSKLTGRFYSENMSEVEASSGLGLYIVQELVTLLDGNFELSYQKPDFIARITWEV